jgi:hypothetical protein
MVAGSLQKSLSQFGVPAASLQKSTLRKVNPDVRPLSGNGVSQMIIGVPQANTYRFGPRLISTT